MQNFLENRIISMAQYIIKTGDTVRNVAVTFGISKSTVHKNLTLKLPEIDRELYKGVRAVLDANKAQRHLRGGIATKQMYLRKNHKNFS